MKLSELQALFQAAVRSGRAGDELLGAIHESTRGARRETLFGVYRNAYRVRLSEFLAEDFPALKVFLGEDDFASLSQDYIDARPPRRRNARWFTSELPDFMAASETWRAAARAISLALFERALTDAFDAADAESLTIEALAAFPPRDWPGLVFDLHPSVILLELAPGTAELYVAATKEDDDASTPPPSREPTAEGVERVAVWRHGDESVFRELDPDEFVALNEARLGRAFGDICQMTAFQQSGEIEPERLAQCLASWFEDGMVAKVTLQK